MLLWFVVLAPIIVAEIFRSPMIDYRIVAAGALLPIVEGVVGHPWILHTALGAASLLGLVVLATQKRRLVRRRLLGLPIGVLLHLVLDGGWTRAAMFWWPAFGGEFGDRQVPELDRSIPVVLAMEVIAVGAAFGAWRRYELDNPSNLKLLLATGQLSRSVLNP